MTNIIDTRERARFERRGEAVAALRRLLSAEPGPWKPRALEEEVVASTNCGPQAVREARIHLLTTRELRITPGYTETYYAQT